MAPRDSVRPTDDTCGLELVVVWVGAIAVLGAALPHLLRGWGGLLLLGGALLSGLLSIVEGVQRGQRVASGLLRVLVVGGLAFGAVYVPLWLLTGVTPRAAWSRVHQAAPHVVAASAAPRGAPRPSAPVTPQATVTLTPVPPPAPPPPAAPRTLATAGTCGQAVVSGVAALALRAAPGTRAQVIGARPQGTTVELLCDAPVTADGITWRRVRVGALEAWMSARFLK